jgi:hypothetical protein
MATKPTQILEELGRTIGGLPDPVPRFDFTLGWADDYDKLFSNEFSERSGIFELATKSLQTGRTLLVGRGGSAKSVILARVAREAIGKGILPFIVSLKGWVGTSYADWKSISNQNEQIAFLFERFGISDLHPRDADPLLRVRQRLILVDGLNEVDSAVGQQIINALDDYARSAINTGIIVSDRLVRRDLLRPERWNLALVLPLTVEQIESVVKERLGDAAGFEHAPSDAKALLSTPYFLNAFLENGRFSVTESGQMEEFFRTHALSEQDLDAASAAAFSVYKDSTRTFGYETFAEVAGAATARRLVESGAIVRHNQTAFFDHHLKHDYLAARFVVRNPRMWGADTFNTLTFHGSSFETIAMVMEQIGDRGTADRFLRELYDWNIYGAGYSIAEGREEKVSPEMRTIILAMFAERQWDIVVATSNRARDTLRLFKTELARTFLQAGNLQDVFRALEKVQTKDTRFAAWRALFSTPPGTAASDRAVAQLGDKDSVFGWTAANVLKRLKLSERQQEDVRHFVSTDGEVAVRWRAIHVLGSFPSTPNLLLVRDQLGSQVSRLRFGATRSLVEMAAFGEKELGERIFEVIADRVALIREYPSVLGELERVLLIDVERAPRWWALVAATPIERLRSQGGTQDDEARWTRLITNLVAVYGAKTADGH